MLIERGAGKGPGLLFLPLFHSISFKERYENPPWTELLQIPGTEQT